MINKILLATILILILALGGIWAIYFIPQLTNTQFKSDYFDFAIVNESKNHSYVNQIVQGYIEGMVDASDSTKEVRIAIAGEEIAKLLVNNDVVITKATCNDQSQEIDTCIFENNFSLQNATLEDLTQGTHVRALNIAQWDSNTNRFKEQTYQILIMPTQEE